MFFFSEYMAYIYALCILVVLWSSKNTFFVCLYYIIKNLYKKNIVLWIKHLQQWLQHLSCITRQTCVLCVHTCDLFEWIGVHTASEATYFRNPRPLFSKHIIFSYMYIFLRRIYTFFAIIYTFRFRLIFCIELIYYVHWLNNIFYRIIMC